MPETQVSGSQNVTIPKILGWQPRQKLLAGCGMVCRVGEAARELGARRLLLVTDPGIVSAGHVERVRQFLKTAGLQVTLFDRARQNPTTRCVDDCVAAAKSARIDAIIGLGGGSSMDTAKGCNFILTNGGQMQDYLGVGKATKPMLPFIAIPTTAGTGSEMQSAALIADEVTHQKMACLDPKCAAAIAILDPELTLSQPARVTACTGVDAISHAVETAVTTKRTGLSQQLSREAFRLCVNALPEVLADPQNIGARARMQLGAALAGAAIENSMLGAAHAAANPLTAHFDVVHGEAVGVMLPHVVRFNANEPGARSAYAELARDAGICDPNAEDRKAVESLVERLGFLLKLTGIALAPNELNIVSEAVNVLTSEATDQWTANFNPRPVNKEDFLRLYEAALKAARNDNHE